MWCTALREVACDWESHQLDIQCYDGDTIVILNANYGRRDNVTCPHDDVDKDDNECIYSDTVQYVKDR